MSKPAVTRGKPSAISVKSLSISSALKTGKSKKLMPADIQGEVETILRQAKKPLSTLEIFQLLPSDTRKAILRRYPKCGAATGNQHFFGFLTFVSKAVYHNRTIKNYLKPKTVRARDIKLEMNGKPIKTHTKWLTLWKLSRMPKLAA